MLCPPSSIYSSSFFPSSSHLSLAQGLPIGSTSPQSPPQQVTSTILPDEKGEGEVSDASDEENMMRQSGPIRPEKKNKEEENKLVEVSRRNRTWYGEKFSAKFVLEDGTTIPNIKNRTLCFRIEGVPIDTKVTFLFETDSDSDDDDKSKYPAQVIFSIESIRRLELNAVTFITKPDYALVDCLIQADACVPVNLSQPLGDKELDKLRLYMRQLPNMQHAIKFKLYIPRASWEVCKLSDQFRDLFNVKAAWVPYRSVAKRVVMTQAGQLKSRQAVEKAWDANTIVKVPATNSFYSLDEAAVKLVYGAHLEYHVSILHAQRLMGVYHKIVLLQYGDLFLGAVSFGKLRDKFTPFSLLGQSPIIPDGTACTVLLSHGHGKDKMRGVTIPKGIDISVSYDIVVLLLPAGDNEANFSHGIEHQYDCKLVFNVSDENSKLQINAVNTLCTEKFARWHPILLNTDYAILPSVNIFQGIPRDRVRAEYQKVAKMKDWNKKQHDVFNLLLKVPGNGFAFIEGIFGCGKTLVQAILARLIAGLGLQVLMVAPTNAALQAVSQVLSNDAPELRAARLVFSGAESLKTFEVQETETLDTEMAMFGLLRGEISSRIDRYHVVGTHMMSYHIDNLVSTCTAEGKELGFSYQANPKSELKEYDAVAEYMRLKHQRFSELLRESKNDEQKIEFIKNERAIFRKALATLESTVVSGLQVLLCTNQLAASDLVRHNFGVGTNGIIIIADEDGQALEPTAWLPITLLRHANDIKAVLRFGDRLQLPPLALSSFSDFSEFAPQMNRSLFDRHLRQHPPAVSLNTQYRMIPTLSHFPNFHTYQGRLVDARICNSITLDSVFESRFLEWTKCRISSDGELPENIANHVGISVSGSVVVSDPATCSRSNAHHVKVVRELLMTVFKEAPYPKASIAIIVPYNAQRALYFAVIKDLQLLTKLPYAKLPRVSTVDSMQGNESDIVLLDWVCGESDGLGFLKNDRRINVGLTRARASLIVLYNDNFSGALARKAEPKAKKRAVVPQLVQHWNQLKRNGRVLGLDYGDDANAETHINSAVEPGTLGSEADSQEWTVESGPWESSEILQDFSTTNQDSNWHRLYF
ncbi:uncharacterized protein TRUGW13939_06134 [Talaromyces rugulosus]|uniref:DNA2/NAM7 helicase-like C-terminal domain-containing protein n=1 Tax=Talaromyces rugulosus TaxID=121627 RepID=A0A7H8QZX5_TALRU|nr:uncharacterized protein TRUGW13939_06134 [Talaromyces rugulosus]QKX59005.1 hypothetical protein TRUGW13939_06134 [Talaromyces rugulosus]